MLTKPGNHKDAHTSVKNDPIMHECLHVSMSICKDYITVIKTISDTRHGADSNQPVIYRLFFTSPEDKVEFN